MKKNLNLKNQSNLLTEMGFSVQIQSMRFSFKLLLPKIQSSKLEESINFLISKRSHVSIFNEFEDFVWYTINNHEAKELAGFQYHFSFVRSRLAEKLWAEGIFIGISVIESLLFTVIKDSDVDNPLREFLERLQDFGLHRPGFIIYPAHSLGVLGFGIYRFVTRTEIYFLSEDSSIAITPQANSQEALYSMLDKIPTAMGIKQKVPRDLLEHYIKSRPLEWLTFNPLMFVKARTFSGSYYENQFLFLVKLKISKAVILMMSVLGKTLDDTTQKAKAFSSSSINNFQTLDIKHYLVFQVAPGKKRDLGIDCVPMNVNKAELAEMSSFNIELDASEWKRRTQLSNRISNALAIVQKGYIQNCISNTKETTKTRVYQKIFDSLKYFERSFRETSGLEDSVVNLAIAFETLLTDYYSPGITKKIKKHLRVSLQNVRGTRKFQQSVSDLYECRGAIVHLGRTDGDPNLLSCRRAYIYSFLFIVEHLHHLPLRSETPISDILSG